MDCASGALTRRSDSVSDASGEWTERPLKILQQQDSHGCGVLALMTAEAIVKNTNLDVKLMSVTSQCIADS